VALVAMVPQLYRRVDDEIRSRIEARIAAHYSHLGVSVRSAELIEGEGIRLRDVAVVEPQADGPQAELLHVEEMLLVCAATLPELVQHEPQIARIVIRRPTLRATRRPDGSWSVAKLAPLPKFSERPVETQIEDATIELFDPLRSPAASLVLRHVNLTFSPVEAAPPAGSAWPSPAATAAPAVACGARRFQGTLTCDHVRQVSVEGLLDLDRQTWSIGGSAAGLAISPELHAALPEPLAAQLAPAAGLRGEADATFQLSYDAAVEPAYQYRAAGRLAGGRVDDLRLPQPLTDLNAAFRVSNDGLWIDDLAARSNQTTLKLSYKQAGFAADGPRQIEAQLRGLELDRRLFNCLPDSLQEQWRRYRPGGQVDLDVKLRYDGRTWQPELSARCLSVSFTYYKFPYRLEDGKGTLVLKDDVLAMSLIAYSGSQAVQMNGEIRHPMSGATGWFQARCDDLPLDNKLLAALPDSARPVVQSLNARGTLKVDFLASRDQPNQPLLKRMTAEANRCSMQYEKFPYPVKNICGTLQMTDECWEFRNLRGENGAGEVTCEGRLEPTLEGKELRLQLVGRSVPLDEELRGALRPNEQQVWLAFRPRGAVDLVADIRYLSESKHLNVVIRAEPQSETTSIEPVHFPYRLEKLRGVLLYRDGHIDLLRIRAEHGPVKLATGGSCDFLPDGRWRFRLENLAVDRVRLDRDLTPALPERLRRALVELRPAGPVNVRGAFELESGQRAGDPLQSRWDVQLDFQQGSLDCGVKLENIHGAMTLAGSSDGRNFRSTGRLALDALSYKDFQFTEVVGPIWMDDQQVLLGSWVARRQSAGAPLAPAALPEKPEPIRAKLFGGDVQGDAWVSLGTEPRYGLHAELSGADVTRCAQEVMTGQQNLRGKVTANLDLRGSGRTANGMGGRGTIQLRDADVYELPLMISLLKLLSIRAPDKRAFSHSDIAFRIEGEHVYFDQIDFNGDAISLLGKGELDFQQNLRLTFHAVVGRGDFHVPVIRDIFAGASKQILLIHVGGTLQDPQMRRETFPGVNQALQQMQNERTR
jgi:hypothetical protein